MSTSSAVGISSAPEPKKRPAKRGHGYGASTPNVPLTQPTASDNPDVAKTKGVSTTEATRPTKTDPKEAAPRLIKSKYVDIRVRDREEREERKRQKAAARYQGASASQALLRTGTSSAGSRPTREASRGSAGERSLSRGSDVQGPIENKQTGSRRRASSPDAIDRSTADVDVAALGLHMPKLIWGALIRVLSIDGALRRNCHWRVCWLLRKVRLSVCQTPWLHFQYSHH
jgi:hypothetical protein